MMQPIIGPKVVSVMKSTIAIGMMLLVVGNLFSAMYDVSIKWLPEGSSAATFLLIRQLTSVLMLLPLWFAAKKPISRHIKVHLVRANTGAIGAICLIMGFNCATYRHCKLVVLFGAINDCINGISIFKRERHRCTLAGSYFRISGHHYFATTK